MFLLQAVALVHPGSAGLGTGWEQQFPSWLFLCLTPAIKFTYLNSGTVLAAALCGQGNTQILGFA